jgi:diguanylate cyclase (GGDEF)-like protein
MTLFFNMLVLLAGLIVVQSASADDLISARAVLEDPSGALTMADVLGRDFQPMASTLSQGYSASAFWLRVQVRAPARGSEVVLRMRPTYLDEIRLFEPDDSNPHGWKTRVVGDRYAYGARDRPAVVPSFVVHVTPPLATYYLRIATTSTMRFEMEALEPREADRKDHQLDLAQEFFVLVMLWLLLWALQDYVHTRQPVVGLFCVYQVVYIFSGLSIRGYLVPWVPADFPQLADIVTSIMICGSTFAGFFLNRELFKLYAPPPSLIKALNLFMLTFPVELAAMLVGQIRAALNINAVMLLVQLLCFIALALSLRQMSVLRRRFLQVSCVVIALLVAPLQLSLLGWFPAIESDVWSLLAFLVYGFSNSGLVAMILYMRERQVRLQARQTAHELELAQQRLDLERQLKEQAEIQARTDYLTGLCNRRHFVRLADAEIVRSIHQQRPMSLLMIDVDHFKSINDTWGHAAGDEVLLRVAQIIRNMLRDTDIAARVGGEEFAVVLVETAAEQAWQIAQRIGRTIENALIASQAGVQIKATVSIGLTGLNQRPVGLDNLLREADQALYDAKQAGRNRVVTAIFRAID